MIKWYFFRVSEGRLVDLEFEGIDLAAAHDCGRRWWSWWKRDLEAEFLTWHFLLGPAAPASLFQSLIVEILASYICRDSTFKSTPSSWKCSFSAPGVWLRVDFQTGPRRELNEFILNIGLDSGFETVQSGSLSLNFRQTLSLWKKLVSELTMDSSRPVGNKAVYHCIVQWTPYNKIQQQSSSQ